MTTHRTSPDGSVTVKELIIHGRTYDLPPWISEEEFCFGVEQGNPGNPLSTLVSCKLDRWDSVYDYATDGQRPTPYFEVEWLIPFGEVRELLVNAFTPVPCYHGGRDLTVEITPEGALINLLVGEYEDFHDAQAWFLPQDFTNFALESFSAPQTGLGSDLEGSAEYFEPTLSDLREDFAGTVKEATGWGGAYVETADPNGEPYFLLLFLHED